MKVGALGSGQLGRMLALAGYPLGVSCRVFDTEPGTAAQVAEVVCGKFEDGEALARFAAGLDVVTYEFENVPVESARRLAKVVPVFPPPEALRVSQDRLSEKTMFRELGIPTPAFAPVSSLAELEAAAATIGLPAVLKTRRFGYDGKGQWVLRRSEDVALAWGGLGAGSAPLILEAFVPFERELSVLAVRSSRGEEAFYPVVQNVHREGILRTSVAPAPGLSPALEQRAVSYATRIVERLGYVGVLALELFEVRGELLANEMAPRVHNSGHWTIEGAATSQFENHLRAILGWPLGGTAVRGHVGLVNLIGGAPDAARVLEIPGAHLHLYGKAPRPGRKIGHVTVRADSPTVRDAGVARVVALAEACAS